MSSSEQAMSLNVQANDALSAPKGGTLSLDLSPDNGLIESLNLGNPSTA
jgi:hypothetical protein